MKVRVTQVYEVEVPDREGQEWCDLVFEFEESTGEYFEGYCGDEVHEMASYLVGTSHVGDNTELVKQVGEEYENLS